MEEIKTLKSMVEIKTLKSNIINAAKVTHHHREIQIINMRKRKK